MAKMFYTSEEAQKALNISFTQLKDYVNSGQLREFRDGPRLMFKADQVDRLATGNCDGVGVNIPPVPNIEIHPVVPVTLSEVELRRITEKIQEQIQSIESRMKTRPLPQVNIEPKVKRDLNLCKPKKRNRFLKIFLVILMLLVAFGLGFVTCLFVGQ